MRNLSPCPRSFCAPLALCLAAFLSAAGAAQELNAASAPATNAAVDSAPSTSAAPKRLTLAAIYDGKDFDGDVLRGVEWTDDPGQYRQRKDGRLLRIDARSGAEAGPAYDDDALRAALSRHRDFDKDAAEQLSRRPTTWSEDRSAVLLDHDGRLYFHRLGERGIRRLADADERRREVDLSPRGGYVSFVRDNDLFVIGTRSGFARRITWSGEDTRLNGVLDWVYQEEIYGRGNWRGYWWSPDERHIAFLQLDESRVPTYTIVDNVSQNAPVETLRYPRAGDPNPGVRLGVASLGLLGGVRWIDLSKYKRDEILIVAVSWSPDGKLLFSVQDREQRWLELNEVDPDWGGPRTLIREESPAWVEPLGHPHWLKDGSFLWLSERDGRRHIYHCRRDGTLIRRVTDGAWDVRTLHGVEEKSGQVFFSGSRDAVVETHAYRVPLAGGAVQRLTEPGYSHRVDFNADYSLFIDTFGSITKPTKVYLRAAPAAGAASAPAGSAMVRVLSENELPALREYQLGRAELLRIPARDGVLLNALLIRPHDFDPARKYPLWVEVYGGPGDAIVRNRWGGKDGLVDHMLATEGRLVLTVDPRSASGDGAASAWTAYKQLGVQELADIEDAVKWLVANGSADPHRVGIQGYSYGGFMTAYALTHSTLFKLGVAGGLLSDWHNYDSVYTERYMQTPQHNPDGYERTSVWKAAENLHGRLLIVHGALDDNVHFLSAAQLIDAIQKAGREFDLMVYPRDRHGIHFGGKHFRETWVRYVRERL